MMSRWLIGDVPHRLGAVESQVKAERLRNVDFGLEMERVKEDIEALNERFGLRDWRNQIISDTYDRALKQHQEEIENLNSRCSILEARIKEVQP